METRRLVLFLASSMAVLLVWNMLFPPPPTPKPATKPTSSPSPTGSPSPTASPSPTPSPGPQARQPEEPVRDDIVLKSKFLTATLTNRGAGILDLVVRYPGDADRVDLLRPPPSGPPHFAFALRGAEVEEIATKPWSLKRQDERSAQFTWSLQGGVDIEKSFELNPETHAIAVKVRLLNAAKGPERMIAIDWLAVRGLEPDSSYRPEFYNGGFSAKQRSAPVHVLPGTLAKDLEAELLKETAEARKPDPTREWCGVRNRFFAVALMPENDDARLWPSWPRFHALTSEQLDRRHGVTGVNLTLPMQEVAVSTERSYAWTLYAGPLRSQDLQRVSPRLGLLVDWGGGCFLFSWVVSLIAPLLLILMNAVNGAVGNYGVAILATTLLVKLALFPLTRKSQISMARFVAVQKQLKPKIELLQARYAANPNKMRQEMMDLYKSHGTSPFPLGGCLPMLIQLPFWISMYTVFDQSIDLRRQAFGGWITDLSQPDHLFALGSPFSFLMFTFDGYINLLPLVMIATWTYQAWMQPRPDDPQMAMQQKMMMFMPGFFGLMMYTLASGLSLYFLANSLIGMAETKLIKTLWIPKPAPETPAP